MSLRLFASILILTSVAVMANATPPPAHGGYQSGWGMNPTNWENESGSFSAMGLYDPNYTGGGASWVVGWNPTAYINYAPITLELWIEMYMLLTYEYTSYQWHRLGNSGETRPRSYPQSNRLLAVRRQNRYAVSPRPALHL